MYVTSSRMCLTVRDGYLPQRKTLPIPKNVISWAPMILLLRAIVAIWCWSNIIFLRKSMKRTSCWATSPRWHVCYHNWRQREQQIQQSVGAAFHFNSRHLTKRCIATKHLSLLLLFFVFIILYYCHWHFCFL